jgi:tetratricopeptide (TPR) repeat protein
MAGETMNTVRGDKWRVRCAPAALSALWISMAVAQPVDRSREVPATAGSANSLSAAQERVAQAEASADSADLIEALATLGALYSENGDPAACAEALRRAIDLSRKVDGVLNPQQLDMVDALIASYFALGDSENMLQELQFALRIIVSAYGTDVPRLVDELVRNAGWLEAVGRFSTAREIYARSAAIASNFGKEKNLLMVEPLRGVARAHRLEFLHGPGHPQVDALGAVNHPRPSGEGEVALELVIEVLDADPESSAAEVARARLDLGDWRMLCGDRDKALEAYREAWTALRAPGAGGTAAFFDVPVQVFYRPPGGTRPPTIGSDRFARRSADVVFTVAADGRVRDVTLQAGDLPGLTGQRLVRAIKEARYRPRFVDGQPVDTSGVKYHETIYVPEG